MKSHEIKIINDRVKTYTLTELMDNYGKDVWNYAFVLIKNTHLADDISQEVFLKAFIKASQFKGESSIKTWLLSITKNAVRDYQKSAFIKKVMLLGAISQPESHPSAENEYLDSLFINETWKAVIEIPVKLREVLVLYAHHNLSLSDISEILGIPIGTVKSRLFKARKIITKLVKEDQNEYETGTTLKI